MQVGDLVVYRYSKAANLRNKIYKVAEMNYGTAKVRVVSPCGTSKEFKEWFLQTLEEHGRHLTNSIEWAQRAVERAERAVDRRRAHLRVFNDQKAEVTSWFPRV